MRLVRIKLFNGIKGYCKNPINVRKVMAIAQNASTEDLNKMDVIKIDFQLVPILVEKTIDYSSRD